MFNLITIQLIGIFSHPSTSLSTLSGSLIDVATILALTYYSLSFFCIYRRKLCYYVSLLLQVCGYQSYVFKSIYLWALILRISHRDEMIHSKYIKYILIKKYICVKINVNSIGYIVY